MTIARPFVGAKFFAHIWSPVENSPDTPYYGKYVIFSPKEGITTEDLAGHLITLLSERLQTTLSQPHLAMIQIYDRNGHEIANPTALSAEVPSIIQRFVTVEHIPMEQDTPLVQASRTPMDVMAIPFNGHI